MATRSENEPMPGHFDVEPGGSAQATCWRVAYDVPKTDQVYRSDVMHSEREVGIYLRSMRVGRPDITSCWVIEYTLTETADSFVPGAGDFAVDEGGDV